MEIRHEFIFFYIVLAALWFGVLTPVLAMAITESPSAFNNSNYSYFVNNSSGDVLQTSSYTTGASIVNTYTNFHLGIWWLDALILSVGIVFGAWTLITVFGGIGG